MTIFVALCAAAAGAVACRLTLGRLIPGAPLRRANYRGLQTPTALGVAVVAGLAAGIAFVTLVSEISAAVALPGVWLLPLAAGMAFAALGLWDDVTGAVRPPDQRGFRAHLEAIGKGHLTGGGLKLLAGSAIGFALAAPATNGFGYALAGGAVIALTANLINSFDVRPGRAGKAFLAGAIPLAVAGGVVRPTLCVAIGAVLAFLRTDLRERAMLGDTGSNALGAFLGASVVLLATPSTLLIVLTILVVLTLVAEGPTLSRAIEAIPPLRAADAWGRVPDVKPLEQSLDA